MQRAIEFLKIQAIGTVDSTLSCQDTFQVYLSPAFLPVSSKLLLLSELFYQSLTVFPKEATNMIHFIHKQCPITII